MALARPMASRSGSVVTFTKTQSSSCCAASGGATQARLAESRKLAEKLRPLEDKLQIELDIHTKKRWSTFDAKHATLIAAHKEATKLSRKANSQYRSSKDRIARKGGWGAAASATFVALRTSATRMTCEHRREVLLGLFRPLPSCPVGRKGASI